MDKSKEIVIVENGHHRACNGTRKCNGSTNGNLTKETMVQLSGTVRNTGCYLSRFQVVIFLFANLLTIAVAIVLVTFVKKEPVIFVTKPNALGSCNLLSGTTGNASLVVKTEQTLNTTLSINNQTENGTESYENTTSYMNPTASSMSFPWDDIRLPRDLIPVHYDLEMRIDLKQMSYVGAVNMTVTAVNPTKFVVFHFYWIYITGSSIKVRNKMTGNTVKIINQRNVSTKQFRVLELESELEAGIVYVVEVGRYNGTITGDLKGLYLSTYDTPSGEKRRLAVTQLQSTDARRMFPCFDEPDMKATFSLTITHQSEYKALSNMPEKCVQWLEGGWEKCTFQKTPIMSTYLLAVVVSDFEKKEKTLNDGYELRVWAQPNKINQTDYALATAEKCYTYFSEYFEIADVVPKADHVAVPDFSAGAMENWGLMLYRETALLYDDEVSSSNNKLMVTLIVAHEVAHTWFGNMVTMKWWDDLWLNEGFASLLMYFAMDHICPEWDVFTLHVVVKEVFVVMLKDALLSSHPVSSPIRTPDDIAQYFDAISYQKGMAVLRMLLGFLGKDDFQAGLRLYVNRFKYQNAEMDQLWETFSEAVDHRFDIKSIMNTWTRQMGYPVVTMKTNGDYYILEQERFLLDGNSSDGESSIYEYMWHIPFTYKTEDDSSQTDKMVWLNMTSATIPRKKDKWILANVDYIGFYRVNYELSMWGKLAEQLNTDHTVFPEANRGGLIGDSFNLARAKLLAYDVALNMTTYLKYEDRYVPWKAFLDSIEYIRASMSKTGTYVLLQKYLHDLVKPVYEKMGTDIDCNLPESYLRQLLLSTACDVGVKSAVDFAKDLFRKWKEDDEPVPSDYSAIVYSIGVREGSVEEWDFVWNKSISSNVAVEREMLMEALAQSQKPWLLWRYANWIFDPTKIKMQDVRLVVSFLAKTPLGRMIALHLLQNKWDKLNEQFGYDTFLLRETIAEVTQYVNSDFEYTQLATLFKNKPAKIAQKETENALTLIRANMKWMKENYNNITMWLRNHVIGML